jgi:hypothetical protein
MRTGLNVSAVGVGREVMGGVADGGVARVSPLSHISILVPLVRRTFTACAVQL